jgi:ADP-heptose:LPS heptosyltransferase
LATLPRYLRRRMEDFPSAQSYLVADPSQQAHWRKWLASQGAGPCIGLCWRSGNVSGLRALQYAPLEAWAAFVRTLPGTLVSLQYDAREDEIALLETLSGREILVPPKLDQKQDIDGAAALMSALDAVATAPTAVSWITAALGVPTFKVLYNTSWTAMGQNHEPFAPAAHCVMPEKNGDWANAFAKATRAITMRLAAS